MSEHSTLWSWNNPMNDAPAITFVAVGVLLILGLSELFKKKGFSKEWTRKTAHIGAGLLAIPFPWMFDSIWPVVLLCGTFLGIMLLSKMLNLFEGVHGVERKSLGAFVFPMIIILIFGLAYGNPLHYSIPIAVLSLSDAIAALIGKKYGQYTYHTLGEARSIEGSTAFLLPTFLIVHIPLLLLTETGRPECVLMALGCAILVTAFEMISVRGLDNVFIPFGTWYILNNYAQYPVDELSYRIGFMFFAGMLFLLAIRYTIFTRTGSVAGFLVLYAIFSLGESTFFLPALSIYMPLLGLAIVSRFWSTDKIPPLGVSHTFQTSIVAILILFVHDNIQVNWLISPFLTAIAGGVSVVVVGIKKHLASDLLIFGLILTLLGPVTYLLLQEKVDSHQLSLMVVTWICSYVVILIFAYAKRYKAVFTCVECGIKTHEKRHCQKDTDLTTGHHFFTESRIGLLSIFVGTSLCIGWNFFTIN